MENVVVSPEVSERVSTIARGLDSIYSEKQLTGAISRRAVHNLIADVVAVYTVALKDLQARLDAIEAGQVVGTKYCGVFQRQIAYASGSLATFKGALWHANVDTAGVEPGDGKTWTLAAKSGDSKPIVRAKANGRQQA
jgi:hypothetical protein